MAASADENKLISSNAVNQKPVRFKMTFPTSIPLRDKGVIKKSWVKRPSGLQEVDHMLHVVKIFSLPYDSF